MIIDSRQIYETPVITNAFHGWVDIHAPIELVFQYLTGDAELSSWWASKCTSEAKPGGKVHYIWDGDVIRTGDAIYRRFEPPALVVIEWTHSDGQPIECDGQDIRGIQWPPLNTYQLAMLNGTTTRVHLHDMGVRGGEPYEEQRRATEQGWQEAMTRLKRVVEARQSQNLARRMRRRDQKKSSSDR